MNEVPGPQPPGCSSASSPAATPAVAPAPAVPSGPADAPGSAAPATAESRPAVESASAGAPAGGCIAELGPGLVAADDAGLAQAVLELRAGRVVIIPTDTVYGVAVDPTVAGASDRLFAAKARSRGVPLAVLVATPETGLALTRAPVAEVASRLARSHWPGALTLVMPRARGWVADLGDAGDTIGIRCPDHPWVRELCRQVGPLATSSANRHGQPSPATAAEAAAMLGPTVALVVDGGACTGMSSTVVDVTVAPARLLREGRLAAADLNLPDGG